MEKIKGFQKFFNKQELVEKSKQVEEAKKYLILTGKLTASEKEEILDFNLMYVKGQSSLNYIIRRINELISFVNCR